jgi:hypothetical protein
MVQPQKLNNGDECEAKQSGSKKQLAGVGNAKGSDTCTFDVTIVRAKTQKSEKWVVHYKPTVNVGHWLVGKTVDDVADFPGGLEDLKTACKGAKKG